MKFFCGGQWVHDGRNKVVKARNSVKIEGEENRRMIIEEFLMLGRLEVKFQLFSPNSFE